MSPTVIQDLQPVANPLVALIILIVPEEYTSVTDGYGEAQVELTT